MPEVTQEVFISYAWRGESEELVNRLYKAFQTRGITIIRDKVDLGYKGLIKEFMQRIGRGKYIVVVISDRYLKSPNCMYELIQISRNGDFYERIFPIVLPDAKIYSDVDRADYIIHWETEIQKLDAKIKQLSSSANVPSLVRAINEYTDIRRTIDGLVDILQNMNTLTADIHGESDFETIFKAIEHKLVEFIGVEETTKLTAASLPELNELAVKRSVQQQLDQGITQIVDVLQNSLDSELKATLDWLSNYEEHAQSAGGFSLKRHSEAKDLMNDPRKLKRFYKELEICLYGLYFSILSDSTLPINEVRISFNPKIYKTAFDIVKRGIPSDNQDVRQKVAQYIQHLEARIDSYYSNQ